jgi:hypothetical protein
MLVSQTDRAVVIFRGPDDEFQVCLPSAAKPANVAGVLRAVAPKPGGSPVVCGEMMADFVAAVRPAVRCRLCKGGTSGLTGKRLCYVFHATGEGHFSSALVQLHEGQWNVSTLFQGSLAEFYRWAETSTGLESLKKKTVRFKYNGGSKPGAVRMVRIEEVERADGDVHICGYDLEKEDLKSGYRRYASAKIEGEIAVLN